MIAQKKVKPIKLVDENFVIEKNLVKDLENWKIKFVLKKYAEEVEKRILEKGSYSISAEKEATLNRKLITIRIKRRTEIVEPKLVLVVETRKNTINNKKIELKVNELFQAKLDNVPKNERYKYPKV